MKISFTETKLNSIVIFLVLYFSVGYYSKNISTESINVFMILLTLLFFWIIKRFARLKKKLFLIYLSMCSLEVLSCILADDNVRDILFPVVSLTLAFIFVRLQGTSFFETFIKVVYFLSIVGILALSIYYIIPAFFSFFPVIVNKSGVSAINAFFTVITIKGFSRLNSICWEPGVFQTLLNLAISFTIFSNNTNKGKHLIILYTALLLTFSTTGYIGGLINILLFLLTKNRDSYILKRVFKYIAIFILFTIAVYVGIHLMPNDINGQAFFLGKLNMLMQGTSSISGYNSASVRYDSFYYPFIYFINNPIIGGGNNGMISITQGMMHNMLTCTPVNFFAKYGFFYGIIALYCIYSLSKKLTSTQFYQIILTVLFLIIISTEQYIDNVFLNIILLIPFMSNNFSDALEYNKVLIRRD